MAQTKRVIPLAEVISRIKLQEVGARRTDIFANSHINVDLLVLLGWLGKVFVLWSLFVDW